MPKLFIPNVADTIMTEIGKWFRNTYPGQIVPEYEISMFATHNRLPKYLSAKGNLAEVLNNTNEDYVFYIPIVWIPLQVVLANVVLSANILRQDIPSEVDADGVGIIHRHPLPGNCSPEDCTFLYSQGSSVFANSVWSEVYPFNHHFNCGCSVWSTEGNTEVVVYDINDLVCTLPQCKNNQIPEEWYMKALTPVQLSKIVVMPKIGKEYLIKLFDLNSIQPAVYNP